MYEISKSDFLIRVGKRIGEERRNQALSQMQLAEMANISDIYLSNIECGKQNPSADVLYRLSKALQISVDALLLTEIPKTKAELDYKTSCSFENCSAYEREVILKIINDIVSLINAAKSGE